MNNIIITGDDTITIDGEAYKIVTGRSFKPGYNDFAPRLREEKDKETGGLVVEFGIHRLATVDGEVKKLKADGCDQFIVLPLEE